MVSFISDKVTVNQVYRALRETDKCYKLLVESIGNGLESERALSQNDSARINTNNSVHVPGNIELGQGLDTCSWPVLNILLRFLKLFS